MSDLLVRVPLADAEDFWKEVSLERGSFDWWKLDRKPKRFRSDLLFFALGDHVVAWAHSTMLNSGKLILPDGKEVWGEYVTWPAETFNKIENPIPLADIGIPVPRGFAYCDRTNLRELVRWTST